MIIVMGLPGAGKSSVLSAAKEKPAYAIKNWGDLMFSIAAKKYADKVKSRDDIRSKLSHAEQQGLQSEVGDALAAMQGKIILDTHCSIETPKGYLPGLPDGILSKFKVSRLVYVTGSQQEIYERRNADPTRVRPGGAESILAHDTHNRALLEHYSEVSGAPLSIIMNSQGKLEAAQKEFLALLG